ncbi:MAG: hypothetical protein ABH858_02890 [Candidatus Omnitrophota bacterium]
MRRLRNISVFLREAVFNKASNDFLNVVKQLAENEDIVVEEIKEKVSPGIKEVLVKLSRNYPLSEEDIKNIRFWLAGNSEEYNKDERAFQDWLVEAMSLRKTVEKYENKSLSVAELNEFYSVMEEIMALCRKVVRFLNKKERVREFAEAIKNLEKIDKAPIIRILTEKLLSKDI